ncbi:hypothetical protein [Geomonas edaphica]|uniref:hypothetical protein n=1 Tax=Geomonas edaphica TaxID=2570226 RepID=UPI0010A8FC8B|nr:hypothetical protein [Geomonas edaphica]
MNSEEQAFIKLMMDKLDGEIEAMWHDGTINNNIAMLLAWTLKMHLAEPNDLVRQRYATCQQEVAAYPEWKINANLKRVTEKYPTVAFFLTKINSTP